MGSKRSLHKMLADLLICRKRGTSNKPYTIFLGSGCSLSSGAGLITDLMKQFQVSSFESLSNKITGLSSNERYAIIRPLVSQLCPSSSAKIFAQLALEGYFSIIFTTNWDDLIEKTLIACGATTSDYIVHINSPEAPLNNLAEIIEQPTPPIKIIKLHGDINHRKFAITNEETLRFTSSLEAELRRYFKLNDLIIIGCSMKDFNVLNCLEPKGGSIWHVNPRAATRSFKAILKARRCEQFQITGASGNFDQFMFELARKMLPSTEIETYNINCNLLIPCFLPTPQSPGNFDQIDSTYIKRHIIRFSDSLDLSLFEFPIVVWHLSEKKEFTCLTAFAIWRRQMYNQLLSLQMQFTLRDYCNDFQKLDLITNKLQSKPEYVFSVCELQSSCLDLQKSINTLKLLSSPRLLSENEDPNQISQEAIVLENRLLSQGMGEYDFVEYGISNVSKGYASWSGLSYQTISLDKAMGIEQIISFEACVQGVWYLAYLISKSKINPRSFGIKPADLNTYLSAIIVGNATEHTEDRLMRESVIKTSRIGEVVRSALENIQKEE